ncbi:MAG: hypothetical protein J7K21_04200 [Desulfurococcales archaeon]|nr:hypothetical protein [Desulfurococcales archaeon]
MSLREFISFFGTVFIIFFILFELIHGLGLSYLTYNKISYEQSVYLNSVYIVSGKHSWYIHVLIKNDGLNNITIRNIALNGKDYRSYSNVSIKPDTPFSVGVNNEVDVIIEIPKTMFPLGQVITLDILIGSINHPVTVTLY